MTPSIASIADTTARISTGPRPLWGRVRFQLGVGLLVASILPSLVQTNIGLSQKLGGSSQTYSFIATVWAVLLGYYLVRRLTRYPGVAAISYVLPTFAISYGLALLVILFFRVDYSRSFLLFSFVFAQVWFHLVFMIGTRVARPSFAVVPSKNTRRLGDIPHVRWDWLKMPALEGAAPHGLVADLRADLPDEWEQFIAETAVRGVPVYHYKQIGETLTGKVEIEHLSENTLGSLLPSFVYLRLKQSVDIAAAIIALPILLPLFAVVAIAIRLDSEGTIFFRQERMGYRGRVFKVWKFRTMDDTRDTGERNAFITEDDDPRITRVGRFLRRTRIDELPQVFNILCGEMSWIGPRPEAVPLSEWYEKELPFYRYRHIVRPGVTGWAQVNQGHVAQVSDVQGKLHYDFYYIKNFSVWLDILITLRTMTIVFTGFGAR